MSGGGTLSGRLRDSSRTPESRFYGFDSFLGLPEGWEKRRRERCTTAGAVPDFEDPRVTVIPGWFQDTLGSFLERNVDAGNEWTTVVHFDADLYSSTLYVLMTLAARLERCYVVFDEFHGDEMRALHNFLQARGGSVSFLGRTARAVQVCGLLETGGGEYMPESIEAAAKTRRVPEPVSHPGRWRVDLTRRAVGGPPSNLVSPLGTSRPELCTLQQRLPALDAHLGRDLSPPDRDAIAATDTLHGYSMVGGGIAKSGI